MRWVVESCIFIEVGDALVLGVTQLEVVHLKILCKPRDLGSLRDDDMAAMQAPVENYLADRFSVLGSDLLDNWLFEKI